MGKIKKAYSIKIISIIVSVVFLFTSTTYGIELSKKSHLRVPLNIEEVEERFNKAVSEISQKANNFKDNKDTIIEETIPRKDWVRALAKVILRRLPGVVFFGILVPIIAIFFELGHYLFNPFHPERKALRSFIIGIELMLMLLFTPLLIGQTKDSVSGYHRQAESTEIQNDSLSGELIEDIPKGAVSMKQLIDNAPTVESLVREGINDWRWSGKVYTNGVIEITNSDTKILYDNTNIVMDLMEEDFYLSDYIYVEVVGLDDPLLAIKISKDKEIIKIGGNYPRETIAVLLEDVKDLPLYNEIKEALDLPEVTNYMKHRVKEDLQKKQMKKRSTREFLDKTLPQLEKRNVPRTGRLLPSDYVMVSQRHVGYAMRGSSLEKVLTFGAGPCVILTLYDRETGVGALTHLDAGSEVTEGVRGILRQIEAKPENIEARIIGGLEGQSEELVYDIYIALERANVSIVEADVLARDGSKAVILDAKDGRVYDLLGVPPKPKNLDITMLMIQADASGRLWPVNDPYDLVQNKGIEKDDSKEIEDPRAIEILNSAVEPIDMVNNFLKGGSNIIIFGEVHTDYKHRITVKNVIDSLEEGNIDYLALELDTWRQEALDIALEKLEKKDEKLEGEVRDELYKLVESQFPYSAYAKDAINAYVDMILSGYEKGIKIVCIDSREHRGDGMDTGQDGYVIVDGKRKTVDEAMVDNILDLKGKTLVLVGEFHAMNNFSIEYTGNELPSSGSIIKKRIPSATIILQHTIKKNLKGRIEIDSFISSLKLENSIGVPNLPNCPISNMSVDYFYKNVLFGKSGDAIILHPSESLKKPGGSIKKDIIPLPIMPPIIEPKLQQIRKEIKIGL